MAFPNLIVGLGHRRGVGRRAFADMLTGEFKRRDYEVCRLSFAMEPIDAATFLLELNEAKRPVAFIVTDMCFPNEADAVANWGGVLARVDRTAVSRTRDVADCALERFSGWDFHIGNNGTIDDLHNAAVSFVDELLSPRF